MIGTPQSKLELSVQGTNPLVGKNLEETPTQSSALIGYGQMEISRDGS